MVSLCSNKNFSYRKDGSPHLTVSYSLPIHNIQQSVLYWSYNLQEIGAFASGDFVWFWNSVFTYVQITYQGKELLKYVSEESPMPPDPNLEPQQHQPCLPGMCRPKPIS